MSEAAPRPLSYAARASKAEVKLGEPFEYAIEVRHAAGERWSLPAELPALGAFRVRAPGAGACRRSEPAGGGEVTTTCTLELSLFALGPNEVPALVLEGVGAGGEAGAGSPAEVGRLEVPGPRVTGVGVIAPDAAPETLALREPAPPAPLLVPTWRPVWAGLAIVAALGLAYLAWRRWQRRGHSVPAGPAPLPPVERLARRLDTLAAERLPEQGRGREFAFRLSELVREYIGAVAGFPALDLTTGEIAARLAARPDPRLGAARLTGLFEDLDLVKFATVPLDPACAAVALEIARELVAAGRVSAIAGATAAPASLPPHPGPLPRSRGGEGDGIERDPFTKP